MKKTIVLSCVKSYDGQTKWMYFLTEDDDLEKYNTIWDKVSADVKKEFDSEPICNKEFLKTKIKSHGNEVTDCYNKKILKVNSSHTCLAAVSLDSGLKRVENYYLQVFWKECKYIEKKVVRHIIDDLESSSDDSDDSDEEKIKNNLFKERNFRKCIF